MINLIEKLKELDAAGDKATQGEWERLSAAEQKERDIRKYANEEYLDIFVSGDVEIMDFGCCEQYYPTEGKEPTKQDSDFITTAANSRAVIKATLSVLKKIADGDDWFDIESAPRDGTEIKLLIPLAKNGFSNIDIGACWQREERRGKVLKEGWYMLAPQGVQADGAWYPCHWLDDKPTHWKHIDGAKHIEMLMESEVEDE